MNILLSTKAKNFLFVVSITVAFSLYPSEWLGCLLFVASFYYIDKKNWMLFVNRKECVDLTSGEDAQSPLKRLNTGCMSSEYNLTTALRLKRSMFFIIAIHQLVALFYVTHYGTYIRHLDFTAFHATASIISETNFFILGVDSILFSSLLGVFYKINHSLLFGQELAVWAFIFSCFVLIRLARHYQLNRYSPWILLCYGFSPAVLLWTSITAREVFELLLLMLAFECFSYSKVSQLSQFVRWSYRCCAVIFMLLACLLHKALLLCVLPLLLLFLVVPVSDNAERVALLNSKSLQHMFCFVASALIPFCCVFLFHYTLQPHDMERWTKTTDPHFCQHLWDVPQFWKEEPKLAWMFDCTSWDVIKQDRVKTNPLSATLLGKSMYQRLIDFRYVDPSRFDPVKRAEVLNANTNYDKGDFIPKNLFQFIYMSIHEYFNYAFFPAVWVIGSFSLVNCVLSLIYLVRLMLFCSALYFCIRLYQQKVYSPSILMCAYLLMSYLFSLGTICYGTALRHNMITDWIIILLGIPLVCECVVKSHRYLKVYLCAE